jgi:hypothetical protein
MSSSWQDWNLIAQCNYINLKLSEVKILQCGIIYKVLFLSLLETVYFQSVPRCESQSCRELLKNKAARKYTKSFHFSFASRPSLTWLYAVVKRQSVFCGDLLRVQHFLTLTRVNTDSDYVE